jgi:class 3 adenylate cyclase
MSPEPEHSISEERLLATILFVDVIGYSTLADKLTPDLLHQVTTPLWDEFKQIIKEYGGVIANQMGDTLVLVWGAPNPQEDDAERAVSASLELQEGLKRFKEGASHPETKSLELRMGIHTGLVVAGEMGMQGDFSVIGDTVNVAQLLEESADPGSLVVSENTYQSIRGAFQVKRLTPIQFKGTRSLMNIFQILEELPQPTKLRYRSKGGLETRLVARDAELEQLGVLFEKTLETNQPRLALVTGDVGIGKSRLLFEFIGGLETQYPALTVMSSRALEQTSRIPYYIWRELWANRFALKEDDSLEISKQKTIEGVRALWGRALGETTAVEAAHFLGHLIGVKWENSPYFKDVQDQPKSINRKAFSMLEEIFQRASQRGPLLVLLDDLHWADRGSLAALKHLWKGTDKKIPLLILGGTRDDFLTKADPEFQSADIINLGPLPLSADLVREAYPILKGESEDVLSYLAQKSGGNPYFLEETVKNVVDDGKVNRIYLQRSPDNLKELLQSRLELLSLEGRATAYLAAVTGRVFWKGSVLASFRGSPGVTQVLGVSSANLVGKIQNALDELMLRELAFLRVGSAFSGEREYIFKHALLQEVAYHHLPEDMKIACHHAIANWLGERAGPERSICVADHYEKAGDYDQAQNFFTQAAEYTRGLGNDEEADDIQYYARTLPDQLSR